MGGDIFFGKEPMIDCVGNGSVAPQRSTQVKNFRGAFVFAIDKNGFKLKGEIDHCDGIDNADYFYGYNSYDTTVKRSLYIDDALYTFSNKYLKMNNLDDLELVKNLKLEKNKGEGNEFEVVN